MQRVSADIAIIVPKTDELRGLAKAMGVYFEDHTEHRTRGSFAAWREYVGTKSVLVLLMNAQNTAKAALATLDALDMARPKLLILFGTALGNSTRCAIGSTVVAERVTSLVERRMDDLLETYNSEQHSLDISLLLKVGAYVEKSFTPKAYASIIEGVKARSSDDDKRKQVDEILAHEPKIRIEPLLSGNDYFSSDEKRTLLWQQYPYADAYDMESAGFALVADAFKTPWLVVRAVSDFGTRQSMGTVRREIVTEASARFLTQLIEDTDLGGLRTDIAERPEGPTYLSNDHLYGRKEPWTRFMREAEDQLDISLSGAFVGRNNTLPDLLELFCKLGANRDDATQLLRRLREQYFTDKYLQYRYEFVDIRSVYPAWHDDLFDALSFQGFRDLGGLRVLDVGIGNGLEIPSLRKGGVTDLVGVDISHAMLDRASEVDGDVKTVHTSAEKLAGIEDDWVDIYLSLRTWPSRFMDQAAALRQAIRVTRPGGAIVISVSNGYLDRKRTDQESPSEIIRGMTIPNSSIVDPGEPFRVAYRLREMMEGIGLRDVTLLVRSTDIYISGRTPERAITRPLPLSESL